MFGQTEPAAPVECDCSTYQLNGLTQVSFDRSVNKNGGYPATTSDCFSITIWAGLHPVCNNLYSITFDFSQVPPCFKKVFTVEKRVKDPSDPNAYKFEPIPGGFVDLTLNQLMTFPLDGINPNNLDIINEVFRICPLTPVDCGFNFNLKIRYKLKYSHTVNGQTVIEDCPEWNEINVSVFDFASSIENINSIFKLSPTPIKNILNIQTILLNNFDIEINDYKGTSITIFNDLTSNSNIDLSNLDKGVYFIKVKQNNKIIQISKVIKD
ncbi:MAG: T9SS type A sorting domain-containing protein [Candidatus Kapabacteria bacterium]|nr:T9SS type A sorting domain-containing protein [Candidatus Kapabacteria bacterium]